MKLTGIVILVLLTFRLHAQDLPPLYVELETNYNRNAFEACVRLEKQVESFTAHRKDSLAANSSFYMGDAYNQLGRTDKALSWFEKEKKILTGLGHPHTRDLSNSLNNLAYLYLQQGSYAMAGLTAGELLSIDRRLFAPTAAEYIESVLYISDIYIQLDRFKHAEQLLVTTLKAQNKNSANRGTLLNKLGELYTYVGQYSRASQSLLEAIDIHAALGGEESADYINAAINLGILYMNQGKYPEAQEIFEVALSNVEPAEPAYASLLNNQALVLQSLGQLNLAEQTFNKIKQIDSLSVGTSHPDYAITLSNLGLVYTDLEKFREAEKVLSKALEIQRSNGETNTLSYARKLNNLARVYQRAGSPDKAVALLEQSLAIFRKNMGKESPEYATSAYNLGLALWRSGKAPAGFKYLKLSAEIRAKTLGKNHPQYAESMLKIAEYQWQEKAIQESRKSFGEVFHNYYFQIDQTFPVLTEEEKSKFYYTNIRAAFDKFNSLAVSQAAKDPELVKDMYNYLVNTKAAIMFATEKVKTSIFASGDSSLIREFGLWQASKEQIAKLYSLNQEHPQLDSLLAASDRLEKELARRSSTFEGQFVRRKFNVAEIKSKLKAGEAAVEVVRYKKYDPSGGGSFADDIGYAFLVLTPETGHQPLLVLIPGGKDLETKFLKYYRNNMKYDLQDAASYKNYFEPLAHILRSQGISRIFFSPDGVYNQINLNSLENPSTGKYVIEEFDVRLVTNTRELAEDKIIDEQDQPSTLIGFPKFNLDEQEVRSKPAERSKRGGINRTWRGGLLRYMRGEEGISVLPGTQVEIEKIAALFGEGVSVFTAQQASEHVAKSVSNPKVLHIATHGYFLEDESRDETKAKAYFSNPLLNAGLILAGAENFLKTGEPVNEEGDDGILTAFEAMNLQLDGTKLVVLSACETALGDVQNGEGVYGLQRAFKLAGSQSIVMSLWNVDDEATQQLMTTFYEEMLTTGDQHAAFRYAQRKVKEKYPSPFYWGAFIMVGI